jgi:hypothetical protein
MGQDMVILSPSVAYLIDLIVMGQCRSIDSIALHNIEERKLCSASGHDEYLLRKQAKIHYALQHRKNWSNQTADDLTLNLEPINILDILTLRKISSVLIDNLAIQDILSLRNTSKAIHKIVFWKIVGSKTYEMISMSHLKPDLILFPSQYRSSQPTRSHVSLVYAKVNAKKYNQLIPYLAFASSIAIKHLVMDENSSATAASEFYPTWKVLLTFKSCVRLRALTLGGVGLASKINNVEFIQIIRALGSQLEDLSLIKLNALTIESLDMIAHYTTGLRSLRLFACEGIRSDTTLYSYQANAHHIEQLLEAIAASIEELDLRYSIEINEQILDCIIQRFDNYHHLRIFAASRINEIGTDEDCACVTITSGSAAEESQHAGTGSGIRYEKWQQLVKQLKHQADFIAVDNLYGEESHQEVFLPYVNRNPSRKSLTSPLFQELLATWPIHLPETFFEEEDNADNDDARSVRSKRVRLS